MFLAPEERRAADPAYRARHPITFAMLDVTIYPQNYVAFMRISVQCGYEIVQACGFPIHRDGSPARCTNVVLSSSVKPTILFFFKEGRDSNGRTTKVLGGFDERSSRLAVAVALRGLRRRGIPCFVIGKEIVPKNEVFCFDLRIPIDLFRMKTYPNAKYETERFSAVTMTVHYDYERDEARASSEPGVSQFSITIFRAGNGHVAGKMDRHPAIRLCMLQWLLTNVLIPCIDFEDSEMVSSVCERKNARAKRSMYSIVLDSGHSKMHAGAGVRYRDEHVQLEGRGDQ